MSDTPTPGSEPKALGALDRMTRFASEDLARAVDRRAFLKRAGTGAFAFMLTLASGQLSARRAAASSGAPVPAPVTPNCAPPGPYCNTGGGILSGCHGAHCFQHLYNGAVLQCRVYYQYYQAGCWTSSGSGGYWTCCDCSCGTPQQTTCGCAQFSGTPAPVPAGPGTKH